MTPARLRWGLILIQIGILVLLVNLDVINYNFLWDLAWAIPIFLIAIGVEKIFTRSRFEFVSYLVVAFVFLGGLYIAIRGSHGADAANYFDATTYRQELEEGVKSLNVVLRPGEGQLEIRDATTDLVYGRFASYTPKPRIDYKLTDDGTAGIIMTSRNRGLARGIIKMSEGNDWTLKFSREIPLEMECYGDHSDLDLNLATTPVRRLKLNADDASIYLRLGRLEPNVSVEIKGGDSELRLRLPRDVGARFVSGAFDSRLRMEGLIEQGEYMITEGYDTLQTRIDIKLDDNLQNLNLRFYD